MSFHNEHRNRIIIREVATIMACEAAGFHTTYTCYTGGGAEYSSGSVLFG